MKLKCVIFDFDGTLFDSMYLWDTVAESYVRSRGKEPKPTVREEVRALSLLQAAEHLKKEYDLAETPEEIMAGIDRIIEHFYRDEVQPKPGVVPFLKELRAKGADVCIATATDRYLIDELLPLSTVITPNIPEGEILSSEKIESRDDMERAAKRIGDTYGCAVLLKGGHRVNDANDLLYAGGEMQWFEGKRIDNPNTHGTGCTLSSAIASNLAKGYSLSESVARAKEYISGALSAMLDLGKGAGPMQHNFDLRGEFAKENTK